jgi:HEAT repeat protein
MHMVTTFVSDRSQPRRHGARAVVRCVAACLLLVASVGCAAWSPFAGQRKAAREREKYGPTADQRIKQFADDAKAVTAGSVEARAAFTERLAAAMVEEHDPRVRCGMLEVAATFDDAAALAICRGGLQDPDERVRLVACSVWGRRGGPEAVELLGVRYRSDTELDVRLRALRALGECRDQAAVPVLAKALEDADPAVQYRAVAALKQVSGKNLGNDVNRWREWAADPEGSNAEWSIAEAFRSLF